MSEEQEIMDRLNSIDNVVQQAQTKVISYATPKIIASVLEIAISSMCIFGIQLIALGFDFSALKTWQFWMKLLLTTIGIFVLYRAVVNARFDKTAERKNVVDARNEYIELNKKKDLDLKEFLKVYNRNSKIEAYIYSVNKKINRLDSKLMNCHNGKKILEYEKELDNLKKLISVEYIEEHIERMHVKYNVVYFSDFNDVDVFGSRDSKTRPNYSKAFNKASFKRMWVYMLTSSILAVSVYDWTDNGKVGVVMSILSTTMMIVTRIATALVEADKLYDSEYTKSYIDRATILKEYNVWRKNK